MEYETTLASNTGDFILTPEEIQNMRQEVKIKVYHLAVMNQNQKTETINKVHGEWDQFNGICGKIISTAHIRSFRESIQGRGHQVCPDIMIIISSYKYVLGFALANFEKVVYDSDTRKLLGGARYSNKLNTDKTLNIKLLCSRASSGVGSQLVHACENVAIHNRCASVHLDAVTTAYGFYKRLGFEAFNTVKYACSTDVNMLADLFESEIENMDSSFEDIYNIQDVHERELKKFLRGATSQREAVLEGIVRSQKVDRKKICKWTRYKTRLNAWLDSIINTVFRDQAEVSFPMTKCLMSKSGNGATGGGGGGAAGGGAGSEGGAGSGAGSSGAGSEAGTSSDDCVVQEVYSIKSSDKSDKGSVASIDY